jgi:excisionase family DNA binding protein
MTSLSEKELQDLITASLKSLITHPNEPPEEDTLLDTKEAAQLLKYEVSSIYGLIQRKKIPFSKMEGKILFSKKELLAWYANGKNKK